MSFYLGFRFIERRGLIMQKSTRINKLLDNFLHILALQLDRDLGFLHR